MTTDIKHKITKVNSFIDESFDAKQVSNFHLSLQIGNDGILATVYDKPKNKYIAFEYFSFQQVFNFDVIADLIDLATKESAIIAYKYKSVVCSVINNLSTLVPNPLFEEDRKKTYLKFNSSLQGNEFILADEIKNLDAQNVFALPFSLKAKLDGLFNNISYQHFSTGLIDSLLAQNRNQTKKQVFVHIQQSHFEVIVIEGKKLLFYNTFNHHSAEDFIYYLLFVCEQIQLNPETIEFVLLGEIEKTSAIYNIMQKYARHIKFGARTDNTEFSYQLQTFPRHFYFTLFNHFLS